MNLAIVTNTQPHHKYFVSEMAHRFNVALIIHPTDKGSFRQRLPKITHYGLLHAKLKIAGLIYQKLVKHSYANQLKKEEKHITDEMISDYNNLPASAIHYMPTVNSTEAINMIKANEIDVICFLGGDLAKQPFIDSAKICSLNFHSGISPIYNGHKSTFHAVKDGRPNLCGGTLMYISSRVDGGDILAQHFTEITTNDSAASLFMKGIAGAVALYTTFINHIQTNGCPPAVVQERTIHFTRNADWTLADDLKLHHFEKSGRMKIYERPAKNVLYYTQPSITIHDIVKQISEITLSKKDMRHKI